MRKFLACMLLALVGSSFAQQPPKLEPLPEPLPPPPGVVTESPGDQPIRITPGENDQVEEFMLNGERVIKVTQPSGQVYYLREDPANPLVRDALGTRIRVPLWVIKEF
jgi:hypothetical protein